MVVIAVTNALSAEIAVAGVTVSGGGGTASVTVTDASFTIVPTATYACTYTAPLICPPKPAKAVAGDVCWYTSPPNAVWSFQAPIPNATAPSGYLIGSVDAVGAYTLYAGPCAVLATADAAVQAAYGTLTVFIGSTLVLNSGKPALLTSANNGISITAKNSANTTTLSASLSSASYAGTKLVYPPGATYAAVLAAWALAPVPILLPVYYAANGAYAAKQALLATLTMQATTLTVHLSLPADSANLGFTFESFYYPQYIGASNNRSTRGFYTSVNHQFDGFIPEAPFVLTSSDGTLYAQKASAFFAMSTPSTGGSPFYTGAIASLLAFRQCPGGGSSYQLLWLTDTAPNAQWFVMDPLDFSVNNTDVADACAAGQWGIFQVWSSTGYAGNVAIAYRTARGAVTWLTAGSGIIGSGLSMLSMQTQAIQVNTPVVGFVANVPTACQFQMQLAGAQGYIGDNKLTRVNIDTVPPAYFETCWGSVPPLAYTSAGTVMCSAVPVDKSASAAAYALGKRRLVVDTCLGETTDCNAVASAFPATCTGWLGRTSYDYCLAACKAKPTDGVDVSTFCDQTKTAYCEASDAHANSADCACLKVDTSSYKVTSRWGMSYPQFVDWITRTYGITGNTSLNPQCWWDTCDAAPDGAMQLSNSILPCPTKAENVCVNLVKNLTVDATSSVKLSLVNSCAISSAPVVVSTPCSSLGGLLTAMKKGGSSWSGAGGGGGGGKVYVDPNVLTPFDLLLLGLVGGATAIMVLCTVGAVVARAHRSGVFS
jgi:hypothetical protein